MKRFNLLSGALPVLFCLFAWSATKACAESVTMTFTGVGGNNSGGVYTYPYEFTVTPTSGPSVDLSLMCIAFNEEIYLQQPNELWTAAVVTAGSLGSLDEEYAYLYALAEGYANSDPTESGAANWAAWALDEESLSPGLNTTTFLASYLSGAELTDAETFVSDAEGISPTALAGYANYFVYEPVDGSEVPLSDDMPQTFIGAQVSEPNSQLTAIPEPDSLLLLGTGLIGLALVVFQKNKPSGV